MDENLEKLQVASPLLAKLVDGNDLMANEMEELCRAIFLYDTDGMHFAAFVGALHAKGETTQELLGFLNATKSLAVKLDVDLDPDKVTDLSGTGGGEFKSLNVSTAASFVVAAAGYAVAKNSYYAVTGATGSADVFAALGIDLAKLGKAQIEQALVEVGIAPVFAPFISPQMANRSRLSRKFFGERQIKVRTLFHLATNIFSPVAMNRRIYGCYSPDYLQTIAEVFQELGFKKTLVFHAEIGMPEISNSGTTTIIEQTGNSFQQYTISAQDLGVDEAAPADLKSGGPEQNVADFINILKGRQHGAKSDLVAINAGASLYSLGDTATIKEGVEKARGILADGSVFNKLRELTERFGDAGALEKY